MTNVAAADTPPAPVLGQVEYDGADIQANWTSDSPPTSTFILGLFKDFGTAPIQSQQVSGFFGMLTDAQVDQTSVYTVQVAQIESGVQGPWSNPVYVVTSAPPTVELTYDDRGIDLKWGVPAGLTVATGALIVLWNTVSGEILANESVDGNRTLYVPRFALDPNTAYAITVAGEVPLSTGPASPKVPIIQSAPSLDELTYELDGDDATITANNGKPNPTYPGLRLYLDADGASLGTSDGIGAVAIMTLSSLGPWQTYTVRLASINATTGTTNTFSRGPFSNSVPLLVQPAEIVSITYDGTTITGSWNPVAGQPAPAGAVINVFDSQGGIVATAETLGTSFSITPNPALQDASYTLGVTVSRGPSFGPPSATVAIVTTTVALTRVAYDGANIATKWTNSGFTSAILHLLESGTVIQSQAVAGSSATMAATLDPDGSYSVALQILGTSASGKIGPQVNIIVAVPEVTLTAYVPNGANTEVTVGWLRGGALTGIDKWSIQLYKNGQASGTPTLVDVASSAVVIKPGNVLLTSDSNTITVKGVKTAIDGSGPESAQAPIIVETPLIVSADYDGTNVVAKWLPAGGPAATTYKALINDNTGGQRAVIFTSATTGTIPFTPGGDATSYNLKVHAFGPVAAGPASSLQLIVTSSDVSKTEYDGSTLTVTWPALTGATSYVVQILESESVIAEQPADGTSAAIAAPLLASGTYSVAVRGVTPPAIGPAGTPLGVLAGPPEISTITADATSVTVTWKDAPGGSAVKGYKASLESPGKTAATATSSTKSATITPSNPALESWSSYTVRVQPTGDGLTGPFCDPVAVLVAIPQVVSTQFDGSKLVAAWESMTGAGAAAYLASLIETSTGTAVATRNTTELAATLSLTPENGKTYQFVVQGLAGAATGPKSDGTQSPVVLAAPTLASVAYDGSVATATWNAATGADGYDVTVVSGGAVLAEERVTGTTASFGIALAAAGSYSIAVRTRTGVSTGPAGSMDVLTAIPGINKIVTSSTNVVATLDTVAGVTNYQGALYEGETSVATATGSGTLTFTYAVKPEAAYSVRAQAIGTSADVQSGPLSNAVPVVSAIPQVTSLVVAGAKATISWSAVADPNVTGYAVTLNETGGSSTTTKTNGTTITLDVDVAKSYTVSVAALASIATGAGSTAASLITEKVGVTSTSYDGALLTASWDAAGTSGASYIVDVLASDAVVASMSASGTSAAIPIALSADAAYKVAVRVTKDLATGPAGTSLDVLSAVPGINTIVTSSTNVVATLDTVAGVTNYQGALYEGETSVATATGSGTLTFTYAVKPEAAYSVRAQAIGTSADVQSGPLTNAVPVVSAIPQVTSLVVAGAKATMSWSAVADPNVTGYAVTLNETGGSSTTTKTNGTTITLDVDVAKSYTVSVAALASIATGAGSTAASLITEKVGVTSTSYDGALLTASWDAAGTSGASYIVDVLASDAVVASMSASGTSAAIPIALSADAAYKVAVRVTKDLATGPAGTSLDVLSAVPGISKIVTSSTNVVATLDTVAGVTNYQGALYEGEKSVATATGSGTLTFTYTVKPEAAYSVRAQAIGTSADVQSGPLTNDFAVISAAPVILTSGYDGTSLTASWSAVGQPAVTGYQVNINDTTASTTTTVKTNALEISYAITLQLTHDYTVTVQAIGDVATGPASGTANPLANSVGYFFPAKSTSSYGYLFRGDIRGPAQNAISVYLPQLFTNPPASIEVQPFQLTLQNSPIIASLPYTLSIISGAINVWQFDTNGIRSALKTAYLTFLQQVELQANGLLPGAMSLLRQVIAQALPLNFAETLYYTYGFDASAGYVNLQPGMRLRVDFESRQFVSPDPSGNLSGFTGSGTSYFPISTLSNGTNLPAIFDAFLSSIRNLVVAANTGGGAGVIDLQGTRFQLPYIRMFVPPTFPSSDSGGAVGAAQNMVILGAPTIALLEQATTQYLTNRNFNGLPDIVWTFFRGRATFIPEVACFVDKTPVYVSVGTTVRQLTEAYAPLPFGESVTLSRFDYRRPIGNVVDAPAQISPEYEFGRSNDVHFSFLSLDNYSYSGGLDCFDLPVLAGDAIDFEE